LSGLLAVKAVCGNQPGDRPAISGDYDLIAALYPIEQGAQRFPGLSGGYPDFFSQNGFLSPSYRQEAGI
jgi:hypothetical protein